MTVAEVLSGSGQWTVKLKADTPGLVRDAVDWVRTPKAAFGHILIFNTRVDARSLGTTRLFTTPRYIGVLLEWRDRLTISGEGGAWWLGDVITSEIARTNGTITQWVADLAPASLLGAAAVNPSAATATGSYQWVTRREALDAVCDAFGLEWHVTARMGLLVGLPADVWPGDPTTVIVPRHEGREGELRTIDAAGVDRSQDLREWANAAYILGPSGVASSTVASGLLDINGNAVTRSVVVQAAAVTAGSEGTVAGTERALRQQTRRHVKLSSKAYDIAGDIVTGGNVYVFDPDQGLVDRANQVLVAGQPLRPLEMRVMAQTWPVQEGMGVWFRDGDGVLTDLSDWVDWDNGAATVELGAIARTPTNPSGIIGSAESGELKNQISYGPWLTFNPNVLFGTSPTNVTSSGKWRRDGVDIVWEAEWVLSGAPGAGDLNLTLPVSIASGGSNAGQIVGHAILLDNGTGRRTSDVYVDGGGTTTAFIDCARNNYIVRAATAVPWTWANGDAGFASGRYRAPN